MSCIWEGHATDLWDALQLRCIVERLLHPYAMIFKNFVSANLTRWHEHAEKGDANSTFPNPLPNYASSSSNFYSSSASDSPFEPTLPGLPRRPQQDPEISSRLRHLSHFLEKESIEKLAQSLSRSNIHPRDHSSDSNDTTREPAGLQTRPPLQSSNAPSTARRQSNAPANLNRSAIRTGSPEPGPPSRSTRSRTPEDRFSSSTSKVSRGRDANSDPRRSQTSVRASPFGTGNTPSDKSVPMSDLCNKIFGPANKPNYKVSPGGGLFCKNSAPNTPTPPYKRDSQPRQSTKRVSMKKKPIIVNLPPRSAYDDHSSSTSSSD
jgi:hypothetical protein